MSPARGITGAESAPSAERAMRRVDDATAVALLRDLVATPSLSGDERRASELLVTRMNALGYRAFVDEAGNAVGVRGAKPGVDGSQTIVLLGHIDTVPGEIAVRIEGDVLHGRGAVDAKGPLACFAVAGATAELPAGVSLVVIGATEEEVASSRGARHAAAVYSPAACIIGEPSHADGITLGYKGRLIVRAQFDEESAHSAGPGISAPDAAFEWWTRVLARGAEAERAHHSEGAGSASKGPFHRVQARIISCASSTDGNRESAEWRCGFRLPPGIEPGEIEHWCREAAAGSPDSIATTLEFEGRERAVVSERSNAVARALAASMRERGVRAAYKLKTGTSDMNVVAPVWRCPIAAYGPGDSSLDHTPIERISLSEYLSAIAVLRRGIELLSVEVVCG